jgi:hypothetical protein
VRGVSDPDDGLQSRGTWKRSVIGVRDASHNSMHRAEPMLPRGNLRLRRRTDRADSLRFRRKSLDSRPTSPIVPAGILRQSAPHADFLLTPGEADIGFKWRCERLVASSSNKVNASRRLPGTVSLLRGLGSFERFMDESQAKGGRARACCVVILEKGKPVARPGRKARERSTLCWSAASPVAEGMLARHKRRSSHNGSRDETQKALF